MTQIGGASPMALKPVLASGVALVSAAAVVAATPEVLRARTLEVAPVSEGTDPAEIAPGEVDLTALSMLGALNAFFGDYRGVDPMRDVVAPGQSAPPHADGTGPGEVPRSLIGQSEGSWAPAQVLGLPLPVHNMMDDSLVNADFAFNVDGALFSASPRELLNQIADELYLDAWVDLIVQPVEVLAGVVGIHLNMRDGWRNVRETVGVILDLAVLLPAQLIVVLRDTVTAFVRVVTDLVTGQQPQVGPTVQRDDLPVRDHALDADDQAPAADRRLELDGAASAAPDSGDTTQKPFGRLRDALAEQTAAIGNGLKDIKEKAKQARADRKASLEEAKEQRRLERKDRARPHSGSGAGTETETGGTGAGTDSSTGGDSTE
jgi:hypothetical protein